MKWPLSSSLSFSFLFSDVLCDSVFLIPQQIAVSSVLNLAMRKSSYRVKRSPTRLSYFCPHILGQSYHDHAYQTLSGFWVVHWLTCRCCCCWASRQLSQGEVQGSCDRISDCVLSLVFFRWAAPMEVNGLLEFYTLYQSALGEELAVIYNSSELFEDYTVRNLIPGSTYLFQIAVRSCSPVSPHTQMTKKWLNMLNIMSL